MSLALPKYFRITIYNGTGVALAATTVKAIFDRPGPLADQVSYSTQKTLISISSLNNATYSSGTGTGLINNSSADYGYYGADIQISVTISAGSPSGDVIVYLESSQDDGTTWPTNGLGKVIGSVNFTATGTKVLQLYL